MNNAAAAGGMEGSKEIKSLPMPLSGQPPRMGREFVAVARETAAMLLAEARYCDSSLEAVDGLLRRWRGMARATLSNGTYLAFQQAISSPARDADNSNESTKRDGRNEASERGRRLRRTAANLLQELNALDDASHVRIRALHAFRRERLVHAASHYREWIDASEFHQKSTSPEFMTMS